MKTLMILFPVTAGAVWLLTSAPFVSCLAMAVFVGMIAAAIYGMWDHITTEVRRYR